MDGENQSISYKGTFEYKDLEKETLTVNYQHSNRKSKEVPASDWKYSLEQMLFIKNYFL